MIEVGVLYADLSQQWAPIDQLDLLPREGVLAIALTDNRGVRSGLLARHWSRRNGREGTPWTGEDNYAIIFLNDVTFTTEQWPDEEEEYKVRSLASPHDAYTVADKPSRFPAGAVIEKFIGAYVAPDTWAQALTIFDEEMF